MKFIMRHAETEDGWPDFERHLTSKGRADAERMGHLLEGRGVKRIIASAATRATETADLVNKTLGAPIEFRRELYGAKAHELMAACGEGTLVVAHNPGCENTVELVTGKWGPRFEPGTVACFEGEKVEILTP